MGVGGAVILAVQFLRVRRTSSAGPVHIPIAILQSNCLVLSVVSHSRNFVRFRDASLDHGEGEQAGHMQRNETTGTEIRRAWFGVSHRYRRASLHRTVFGRPSAVGCP